MVKSRGVAVLAVGAVAWLTCVAAAAEGVGDVRRPKKLIAVGWDLSSDTAWIRKHHEQMQERPFNGIVINVVGRRDDDKPCQLRLTFQKESWKYEWFEEAVEDLKACNWTAFTDNFIMVHANPGSVDWFDDEAWREVVAHWRVCARVAKQSGCRGIAFDPEPYHPPHAPFKYAAQVRRDTHTFSAYAAKVRERGRACMNAVAAEYPDITILAFFLNSICGRATGRADPRPLLESMGYGLLPAFIDGWLDVVPPGITMVDGHEHAYRYNSDKEFLEAANLIRGRCQEFVSPANRATYRARVQVGFGIYLDAHVNPATSPWHIDPLGGPRVERLRANVRAAVRCADEYVWIYGEKCRWWPTSNKRVTERTWPEALPGCEEALRWARDPVAGARWTIQRRRKAGDLKNVLANGDFTSGNVGAGGRPDEWGAWQAGDSKGAFSWDAGVGASAKGSGRIAGVAQGCFIRKVDVEPGRRYAVEAVRRLKGKGDALLTIRWQTADEKWTAWDNDVQIPCTASRDAWGGMFGAVEVPDGAARLVILLLVRDQVSEEDVAWFDDVRLYRLD